MKNNNQKQETQNLTEFRVNRVKKLSDLYSDTPSLKRRFDQSTTYKSSTYATSKEVRAALDKALTNRTDVVETSKKLYATNPIYASVVEYMSNMYL